MTTIKTPSDTAAMSLGAMRFLERHGLDYCGGKRPFDRACRANGLMPERRSVTQRDYLNLELQALGSHLNKVIAVHNPRDPDTLNRLFAQGGRIASAPGGSIAFPVQSLEADLHVHIHREDSILFPDDVALERHSGPMAVR